jgi:hypothetical protein
MGHAPASVEKIAGYFTEKEHGKTFEYIMNPELVLFPPAHGGRNVEYPHLIFVGPLSETRMARVLGNVAHVVVDEIERNGESWFVIEKWNITKHRVLA